MRERSSGPRATLQACLSPMQEKDELLAEGCDISRSFDDPLPTVVVLIELAPKIFKHGMDPSGPAIVLGFHLVLAYSESMQNHAY